MDRKYNEPEYVFTDMDIHVKKERSIYGKNKSIRIIGQANKGL